MIISNGLSRVGVAGLLLGLSLAASAREQMTQASADIRRTSYGVPHIRAVDERGLGLGMGYAYAQDNLCLLANEVTTVNGQRARFFGPDQATLEERNNLASDVFFNWLNTPEAVAAFWKAQTPAMQQRLEGYVAGYNRYLKEQGAPAQCQSAWVRPLVVEDLVKLTRRLLVEGGIGQFAEALVGAAPPQATAGVQSSAKAFALAVANQQRFTLDRGSNAVAVGRDRSFNGRGMLLANPHFPWVGGMRFYQMHLTIPDQLDVMGAALPGLPVVNIGFNQHVAWTHTVDTSKHFTLYRLTLDPKDATRYLLDDKSIPLDKTAVTVQVKQADGSVKAVTHTVYSSQFGPVVQWPGKLDWDSHYAFSLRDANLGNDRVLQQWYAMNRAGSLKELQTSVHTLQGIPWVNTLAADDQGQSLYMNLSVVPNVSAAKLATCSDPRAGLQMIVLDGAHSACAWDIDPRAAQPGIFPADQLPQLQRTDYVQHSNDSAWMANPEAPLSGFSPVISQDHIGLGPRARFALQRLQTLEKQPISVTDLQNMVMDKRSVLGRPSHARPAHVLRQPTRHRRQCAATAVHQPEKLGPARQPRQRRGPGALHQPDAAPADTPRRLARGLRPGPPPDHTQRPRHRPRPGRQSPARSHAGLQRRGGQTGPDPLGRYPSLRPNPHPRRPARTGHLQRHANRAPRRWQTRSRQRHQLPANRHLRRQRPQRTRRTGILRVQ